MSFYGRVKPNLSNIFIGDTRDHIEHIGKAKP